MISVILPLSQDETGKKVKRCLDGLTRQRYQNFEVIIITFSSVSKKILKLFKKYPFVKVITGNWNKSAARNIGAKKAKGKYLFNLDADMKLTPNLFAEAIKKARRGSVVITFPEKGEENVNFWGKCRALERKIIDENLILKEFLFIKKSLFQKIGGYDETVDPLDDWGLYQALKKEGVKFDYAKSKIIIYSSFALKNEFQRLFERGQAIPALQEKYPQLPQMNLRNKLKTYQKKWRLLCLNPLTTLGLIFLKTIDFFTLYWGKSQPKKPYSLTKTSQVYDQKRLGSNYFRYKHFVEKKALLSLLGVDPGEILEVGCGTGRITTELIKKGFQVTPTDPSEAMLKEYRKKKGLPSPINANGSCLPFKKNKFKTALALRVIWHLPKEEQIKVLLEMGRVSSSFILVDIANQKRFLAKFVIGPNTYPITLKNFLAFCQKNKLEAQKIIPLDVSLPLWLNLIPQRLAEKCFPGLYQLDLILAKIISPGRYLIKLRRTLN